MVYSVSAVSTTGKVSREHGRGGNSQGREAQTEKTGFSEILKQEVEEKRKETVNCRTLVYGRDSRLHRFEYLAREYN